MIVKRDDFGAALNEVEPSAMREVLVELPKISWDDVGGLQESVEWPLSSPEKFDRMGVDPRRACCCTARPAPGRR